MAKRKPREKPPKYRLRFAAKDPFRVVPADTIEPHELNWRTHGEDQLSVLRGALGQVGIVDVGICFEEDGKLVMIDGHARRDELGSDPMAVVVLDVNRSEANFILATLDPITGLAGMDEAALDSLLREVQSSDAAVSAMLADLAEMAGVIPPEPSVPEAVEPGRQTYQILIDFDDEESQGKALEELVGTGYNCRSLIN